MRFRIVRDDPKYPLVDVCIPVTMDPESPDILKILEDRRITLMGRWKPYVASVSVMELRAPALLEDEHVKPPKKRVRRGK